MNKSQLKQLIREEVRSILGNELVNEVKTDKYGNHLEPQFKKGDKVTYLGNKGVITGVNKGPSGVYSYSVSYDKGSGRTKASNISNKGGEIKTSLKSQFVNEDEEFTDNLNIGDKVRIDKQEFEKRYPMYKLYTDKGEIWDMEKTDYFSDKIIISVTIKHKDPIGNHDILSIEPQDYDLIEII